MRTQPYGVALGRAIKEVMMICVMEYYRLKLNTGVPLETNKSLHIVSTAHKQDFEEIA